MRLRGVVTTANAHDARYVRLAMSFPVLARYAPGVCDERVDLDLLDMWASGEDVPTIDPSGKPIAPNPGRGARHAARFILAVWNTQVEWRAGRFDLFEALVAWDHEQTAAFRAWVTNPWRP